MRDGIIIGGGLAGLMAGIWAQVRGKETMIISEGIGSLTHVFSGLHFGHVEELKTKPGHPYALLANKVPEAARAFSALCPPYSGEWDETEETLTPLGKTTGANLVPHWMNSQPLHQAHIIYLVVPQGLKDCFPELVKANLTCAFPHSRVETVPVSPPDYQQWFKLGRSIPPIHYAKYWQKKEGISCLKEILDDINQNHQEQEGGMKGAVVFPGLAADFAPELDRVLKESSIPVVGLTSIPPSGTGEALYHFLVRRYKGLGGELLLGASAREGVTQGGLCRSVVVESKGRTSRFSAKEFILAGGGILGGGIEVNGGIDGGDRTVRETVFGLPLFIPSVWTTDHFSDAQPYAQTGVEVDEELRPLDPASGQVERGNVRVIGRMLAHWDPWTERCGGGVSITSGYLAAERMGES